MSKNGSVRYTDIKLPETRAISSLIFWIPITLSDIQESHIFRDLVWSLLSKNLTKKHHREFHYAEITWK